MLTYPYENPPDPGESIEVAPGVFWIRMPLPFALDHINLWLLKDSKDGVDGWTIVDTGYGSDETHALWERHFVETCNLSLSTELLSRTIILTMWDAQIGYMKKPVHRCG